MGLVYDIRVRGDTVHVVVTVPHPGRPEYRFLVTQGGGRVDPGIRDRLQRLDGVNSVVVFSDNPSWTVPRLTDRGREALGLPAFRESPRN